MNKYLRFYDKRGDYFNFSWDDTKSIWRGHIDCGLVSEGLIESQCVYVLEEVLDADGLLVSSYPIGGTVSVVTSPTGASEHFLYSIPTGASSWLEKQYSSSFAPHSQTHTVAGPSSQYPGIKQTQGVVRSEALQVSLGFHPSKEDRFESSVTMYMGGTAFAEISLYGEGEGEDERMREVLSTLGHDLVTSDATLFKVSDPDESEPDWKVLNSKRKELLAEHESIFPYIGSYRALITVIKYFGYTDVRLKEYWRNVDEQSPSFGKLRHTDVVDIFDRRANFRDSVSVPSKVLKKTNMFGLFYDITRESGDFDDQGVPVVEEVYTFTPEEVLAKMFALKNKLKESFLPLSAHIVDIVGEAVFFGRFDMVARPDRTRVDAVSLALRPSFVALPSPEGWIQDLRPLYHYGCPVGPDLTLDGTTDILSWRIGIGTTAFVGGILDGVQTYRQVVTVPGPTSYTVDTVIARDPDSGKTAYSGPEIADAIARSWREHPQLGDSFVVYQEGGTSGVLRFVQRDPVGDGTIFSTWFSNTTGVIPSGKYTIPGPTGGTSTSINVSSGPSGTFGPSGAPLSYYGDCFLAYFDDINEPVTSLNDDEGIPVGLPVTLRNTTFDVTWDQAEVTYSQLAETLGPSATPYDQLVNSYTIAGWTSISDPILQGVTGFPFSLPTQNTYSWETLGYYSHYEMQWLVTYEGGTHWVSDSGRGRVQDLETYPVILPYEGTYTVEVRLWDLYNTKSWRVSKGFLTARMPEADFIGWYQRREEGYTWQSRRTPVQSDYSRTDPRSARQVGLTWDEYTSTWDLPLHPNEEVGMVDLSYHSMDAIEFYQSATAAVDDPLIDRDPYYFNLIEKSQAAIGDLGHVWWDIMGSKITQVNVPAFATGPTAYVFASHENFPWDITDPARTIHYVDGPTGFTGPVGVTSLAGSTGDIIYSAHDQGVFVYDGSQWKRKRAFLDAFVITGLDSQPTYRDAVREAVRQMNEDLHSDPRELPVLKSYIWAYNEEYDSSYALNPYMRGESRSFDKGGRHRFRWYGATGDSRSYETVHFGHIGDIPTGFEIYAVGPTSGSGSMLVTGMTGPYPVGATNLVDLEAELNGPTAQSYPGIRNFLFNLVLGYSGWAGGSGPTGSYTEVKVQAVAKAITSPDEIEVEYSGGVVGTVLGRSLVKNPTYDDLRCLKYSQELPILTLVNFTYDNCRIWGKTAPTWILTKEGDSSFRDRYSQNRYFSYLFTQRGSYTITLELRDTNGNVRRTTKKELIRIV